MLKHGSLWEEIFEARSYFWPYDSFGQSVGDKYRKIMDLSVLVVKMFWGSGLVSVLIHIATLIFVQGMLLPHPCWIPGNNSVMRVILYTLESVCYMESLFLVGVFDTFYLLMCMNLKIQFALLSSKAVHSIQLGTSPTRAHEEVCLQKLKQYNRYHQFLLK
jgi:hypothetical protein